ncbi:MAG: peptide ABC transporter substrate-binding protein [Pseudomonadota bacterium]
MRKLLLHVLFVAGIAFASVGCKPSGDAEPTEKTIKVLTRGNGGDPGSLDPALATDIHAFHVLTDLCEGLVTVDASGSVSPGVATEWRISPDSTTYSFSLRPNARWSNGDLVVAQDFVRAFAHLANPDTPSPLAYLLNPIRGFAEIKGGAAPLEALGVHASDPDTLVIEFAQPTAHALALLSLPLACPRHADPEITNGAYQLVSWSPLDSLLIEKNPFFHGASEVFFDQVRYLPVTDEATEHRMFVAGELDLTEAIPVASLQAMSEEQREEVRIAPVLGTYFLALDINEAPSTDRSLRRALSSAINRQTLAEILGRGERPAYRLVPPGTAGQRAIPDMPSGSTANAFTTSADLVYLYDTGSVHEKIALTVQSMWREALGLEINLDAREWQYFLDARQRREQWSVMRFSWFADYNDALAFLELFREGNENNLPGYANPEFEQLLDRAASTADQDDRAALLTAAERMLLDDAVIIPLYFMVSKHMVDRSLSGFIPNALDRHPSRFMRRKTNVNDAKETTE